MKKKTSSAGKAGSSSSTTSTKVFGVTDFIDLIDGFGESTWSTFAAAAPVEAVAAAYGKHVGRKKSWPEVPVKPTRKDDEMANLVPVVQVKDSAWSVIYRVIGMPYEDFEDDMKHAKAMSAALKTRALAFFGHDTSGAMSYVLYKDGKEAGKHDWDYRSDPSDKQFAALELYVPACYASQDEEEDEVWLSAEKPSIARIERADVIEIRSF
jgi:hypothetical protein